MTEDQLEQEALGWLADAGYQLAHGPSRESVRAKLRLMVKRILRKYKYPPDGQDGAVELVLLQVHAMGEAAVA